MSDSLRIRLLSISLIVGFFLLWEILCIMLDVSDLVVPRPSAILVTMYDRFPVLWPHILQTLSSTLIGFALGVTIGRYTWSDRRNVQGGLRSSLPIASRFLIDPKGRRRANICFMVRLGHHACNPDRHGHLRFPDRGEYCHRTCHHRTRA